MNPPVLKVFTTLITLGFAAIVVAACGRGTDLPDWQPIEHDGDVEDLDMHWSGARDLGSGYFTPPLR